MNLRFRVKGVVKGSIFSCFVFCLFEGAFLVAFSFCIRLLNARIEKHPSNLDHQSLRFLDERSKLSEQGVQSMGGSLVDFFKHTVFPAPGSHHTDPHGDFLSLLSGKKTIVSKSRTSPTRTLTT